MHYVSAGRGTFTCAGRTHALAEGALFLICPSQVAGYAADREEPWEYCWVGFNGTEAGRLLSLAGFSRETPVLRPPRPEGLKEMLLHIYRSGGNTPAADADMVGYLYLFLAELIRRNERQAPAVGTKDYLEQAVRFIQRNYASDIGVSDVAAYAGVSRSQLYRTFQAGFGLSPPRFSAEIPHQRGLRPAAQPPVHGGRGGRVGGLQRPPVFFPHVQKNQRRHPHRLPARPGGNHRRGRITPGF